jgi:hypothetical protein
MGTVPGGPHPQADPATWRRRAVAGQHRGQGVRRTHSAGEARHASRGSPWPALPRDRGCHTQIAPRARESRVGGGTCCGAADRHWVWASARDCAGADRAAWTGGGRTVAVRRSAGWLGRLAPCSSGFCPRMIGLAPRRPVHLRFRP